MSRYLIDRYRSTKLTEQLRSCRHRGFFASELNSSLTGCYPGAHPRTVLIQTATSGSAPRSVATRAHLDDERRSCCGFLEFNKLGAVGDLIARRHVKADDLALSWRGDGVLHLHGLENQKRRSLLDDGAGLGHQGDDPAGPRVPQPPLDVIALAADVERVDKRERP